MRSYPLEATGEIEVGDAGLSAASRLVLQIEDVDTWNGSLVIQGRVDSSMPWVTLAVTPQAVSAPTLTPMTAAGVYYVEATGLYLNLDYTHTSGEGKVSIRNTIG